MWCLLFRNTINYWPRRSYKTPLQRLFRQLPCNIELLTPEDHNAIHREHRATVGGMPPREFMEIQIAYCFAQGCSKSSCKIGRNQPNESDTGG